MTSLQLSASTQNDGMTPSLNGYPHASAFASGPRSFDSPMVECLKFNSFSVSPIIVALVAICILVALVATALLCFFAVYDKGIMYVRSFHLIYNLGGAVKSEVTHHWFQRGEPRQYVVAHFTSSGESERSHSQEALDTILQPQQQA